MELLVNIQLTAILFAAITWFLIGSKTETKNLPTWYMVIVLGVFGISSVTALFITLYRIWA